LLEEYLLAESLKQAAGAVFGCHLSWPSGLQLKADTLEGAAPLVSVLKLYAGIGLSFRSILPV
jgi:hypothetical protein